MADSKIKRKRAIMQKSIDGTTDSYGDIALGIDNDCIPLAFSAFGTTGAFLLPTFALSSDGLHWWMQLHNDDGTPYIAPNGVHGYLYYEAL